MNVTMATKRRAYTLIGQKVLHRAPLIFAFGRASWMEKKEWIQYLLDITLVSCSGKEGENYIFMICIFHFSLEYNIRYQPCPCLWVYWILSKDMVDF